MPGKPWGFPGIGCSACDITSETSVSPLALPDQGAEVLTFIRKVGAQSFGP